MEGNIIQIERVKIKMRWWGVRIGLLGHFCQLLTVNFYVIELFIIISKQTDSPSMPTLTVYSLKIKIVSLTLPTRNITAPIECQMLIGNMLKDSKTIMLRGGLLEDNVTLVCEVNEREMKQFHEVEVKLFSSDGFKRQELMGSLELGFDEFKNIKMRKFSMSNSSSQPGEMEAFLLLLPTRIIDANDDSSEIIPLLKVASKKQEDKHSTISLINIHMDEEDMESSCSNRLFKICSIYEKSDSLNRSHEVQTQTYNVESLLTLNQILEEANNKLELENEDLRNKLHHLQNNSRSQQTTKKQDNVWRSKIDQLEALLESRQKEVEAKTAQIHKLKSQNSYLINQLDQIRDAGAKKDMKDLQIDEIMLELSKYANTAKRYKTGLGDSKKSEIKHTEMPRKSVTTTPDFVKPSSSRSIGMKRQKSSVLTKERKSIVSEQTFDSMVESVIVNQDC